MRSPSLGMPFAMSQLAGRVLSRSETEAAMLAVNDSPSESRALIPLAPTGGATPAPRAVPRQAAFLAHLIATARQVPQTRERRRAEPAEVIAAYTDAIAKLHAQ